MKEVKLCKKRYQLDQGGMLAVLGCELKKQIRLFQNLKSKKVCEIANDNAEGQTIVSGNIESD